jgi:hypothetical protein
MMLWKHFLVSVILCIALFPFFGIFACFTLIGGFLIDLDHPLYYFLRFKNFNLKKAYDYFRNINIKENKEEYKKVFRIFHNIETVVFLIALLLVHLIFLPLFIGLVSHLAMDAIEEFSKFKNLSGYVLLAKLKQKPL